MTTGPGPEPDAVRRRFRTRSADPATSAVPSRRGSRRRRLGIGRHISFPATGSNSSYCRDSDCLLPPACLALDEIRKIGEWSEAVKRLRDEDTASGGPPDGPAPPGPGGASRRFATRREFSPRRHRVFRCRHPMVWRAVTGFLRPPSERTGRRVAGPAEREESL